MKDYYAILGLEKGATEADIKKSYRKKAQEFHPDKNPGNTEAEARFKELQEAYEVLSDPKKKAHYDQFGTAGGFNGDAGFEFDPSQFGGFADLFESFFGSFAGGQGGRTREARRKTRGTDIEAILEIKFEEAIFGSSRQLEITKPEVCSECKGEGIEPGSAWIKCPDCQGQGQIRVQRQTLLGQMSSVQICPRCHGRGEIPEKVCKTCSGKTVVKTTQEVSVKIPAGIEDGSTIRLKGKGAAGAYGGEYGDLFLHIRISSHPKFKREGQHIHSEETIHVLQAILGATIMIDTIHGKAELKIPPGTQGETVFTIKGKGAPALRSDKLGDHHVRIHLKVPDRLNKEEQKLYLSLAEEGKIEVQKKGWFF